MGGWGSGGIPGVKGKPDTTPRPVAGGGWGSGGLGAAPAGHAHLAHHSGGFGGFLHGVASPFEKASHGIEKGAHWVGEKASLAGHDIQGIPGGTYHLFKPLGVQAYDVARYGPRDAWGGAKG